MEEAGETGVSVHTTSKGTRNVAHMGIGFFLLFFAFNTVQALQSSINDSVGIIALGLLYLVFSLASLLGATPMTAKLGAKWALLIGAACYIPYLAANIHVIDGLLIGMAPINGFGAALLWTGQGVYLTENSTPHNQGFHSGVFWGIFQVNTIGNLVAQLIRNTCTDKADLYLFIGLTAVAIFGVILLSLLPFPPSFLELGKEDEIDKDGVREEAGPFETLKLIKDPRILHLSPLFLYVGMTVTFYFSTFTAILPPGWLGYVMTCFGFFDTLGSVVAGKISDKFGRKPIILFGVLTSLSGLMLASFSGCGGTDFDPCDPGSDGSPCTGGDIAMFFIAATLNGFSDGIYNTQLVAVVGDFFPTRNTTEAFALSVFMRATMSGTMFFISLGVGIKPQAAMLVAMLLLAAGMYIKLQRISGIYSQIN